ncbi:brix domain-containing protein [Ophiostoma piceae UAMH 11346]|uniref:Ribosome production factor 2 homolog n=1 Tax=Ophiostoma piceae (strain UAMH 11346) TaxID=1262450 RepID=S3CQN0_OPHP1|nr:brix domain-containing protein [Ophiostoma piceae UAMH 11346]
MLRQITPRNARSKRALDKRAPKAEENPKTCLFLRGTSASQIVQDCLTDLHAMRAPLAKKFTKKNDIHPFEDPASLEFFSRKNDCSMLLFGSSSKKRRHCLTLCRTFDHAMLDMLEMYVDETSFTRIGQFTGEDGKKRTFPVGSRPMLLFSGTPFYEGGDSSYGAVASSESGRKYALAKSLLTDFFRGDSSPDKIDVEGLSHIIVATAVEPTTADGPEETALPLLHLRTYALRTKRSGQRMPRIELDEIGPRLDVRLGRMKEPDTTMLKEAMRKAKTTEMRTKKNIEVDSMGDKIGRVHQGRQDLGELQTRKMKGLKRGRGEDSAAADDSAAVETTPAGEFDGISGVVEIKNDFSKKARRS